MKVMLPLRLIGLSLFTGGIALGVYALFRYLQTGINNPPILLTYVAPWLPPETQGWLARPRTWIGLQRTVFWALDIPLFAWAILAGMIVLLIVPPPHRSR